MPLLRCKQFSLINLLLCTAVLAETSALYAQRYVVESVEELRRKEVDDYARHLQTLEELLPDRYRPMAHLTSGVVLKTPKPDMFVLEVLEPGTKMSLICHRWSDQELRAGEVTDPCPNTGYTHEIYAVDVMVLRYDKATVWAESMQEPGNHFGCYYTTRSFSVDRRMDGRIRIADQPVEVLRISERGPADSARRFSILLVKTSMLPPVEFSDAL